MTNDFALFSEKQLNDKTEAFIKEFKPIIETAAANVGLNPSYFDEVVSDIAIKFSRNEINFDPSKGVEFGAFIYTIARNTAINYRRHNKKWGAAVQIDGDDFDPMEYRFYETPVSGFETEDDRWTLCEVMKRLSKGHSRAQLVIFVRYFINRESYVSLAKRYHKKPTTVASANSRILKEFKQILHEVYWEENHGCFVESTNSIDFLLPYLPFSAEKLAA